MSADRPLSSRDRRLVLSQLTRARLSELTKKLELDVNDRRSVDAHIDAIIRKRALDFRSVLGLLRREELQSACQVLGLDSGGREKAALVERILGEDQHVPTKDEPAQTSASRSSAPPPMSVRSTGALKSALRLFVLDVAGGFRGRQASREFTSRLLGCFGWNDGQAPGSEMPASVPTVANGKRGTREVALLWRERRVLVEVVKHDVMLDFAWKDLLRACLQLDPAPQYVVLTNQRDLHLYDLGRDRENPRLSIPLDDLPKYSEAFPFLSPTWVPGTTPKIINVSKVSREVAELVARLYRSLKEQHPKREREVVQFTLQCILTMFAEDIGLLPHGYFTTLLYEGARQRDVEKRLRELFRMMSTRDVPPPRAVPFFNGGLFTDAVTLPLGDAQLAALTKASEANWKYVDPHIFGSVFQGIMNDAERHKRGAHYTAHDDIMRIVGPTIVEPWRQRIRDAKSLAELLEVRTGLLKFRVLDPACGSGNFLYVAFREMYRLDTELVARIREFPSAQARVTWGVGIQTANFFGIDINPFAVELAKVTLNIAKKIAFDERREIAADLAAQAELQVDPSLPLDNLDSNIVCADALFASWPQTDCIVGNPPFLGGIKIREELGPDYLHNLQERFPGINGRADYCTYWFRRAHDHLCADGRAGLVGTNTVREGHTRAASLDYIVDNGGTITNAVSSRSWPGEAAVSVSMVNWTKRTLTGPHTLIVDDQVFELPVIAPHLQLHVDAGAAVELRANADGSSKGIELGTTAFRVDPVVARQLAQSPRARPFIRALAHGKHLLTGRLTVKPEFVVDLSGCQTIEEAAAAGPAFEYVRENVLPFVEKKAKEAGTDHYRHWLATWWRPFWPREEFFQLAAGKRRILACSKHAARPVFVFLSRQFVPTESLQLFAFDDDYTFGVLQSTMHWRWAVATGSKLEQRIRYTMRVWKTFPWPQEPREQEIVAVATTARELRYTRDTLMKENGWSLRALYQAADVVGDHPLKAAQAALDDAVRRAYGVPADQETTEFLFELNQLLAEDEAAGKDVQGPGVPKGLDGRGRRWVTDDCIVPPGSGDTEHG